MKNRERLGYFVAVVIFIMAAFASYHRNHPPAIMMSIGDQK
ncbi:hypothetical protein [Rhizobium phage RHph_N46]|nr:hypothetical protein [Rhizobium phage RHph_N46]